MAAAKKKPAAAPDLKVWVEPSVRTWTQWTSARIRTAEIAADGGSLYQLAQLCEWIMADDRVAACLNTRVNALLGLEPTFEASGDKRRAARPVKALDAGEDWWTAYPESEVSQILRWGLIMGLAPARHYWTDPLPDHDGRRLPNPEFWHPQHLRFDWTRQWRIRVAQPGTSSEFTEVDFNPGDGEWILHTPFGKNRPWALGLWKGLKDLVLAKHLALEDWSRVGEKGAILTLEMALEALGRFQGDINATDDPSDTTAARKRIATDLYNRGREAVAALPPGLTLKATNVTVDTDKIYKSLIDLINTAIAVLIRGGNLGTENQGGSRAATESQADTGDGANLRLDAQAWASTAHDQSLVWWAQFNYGDSQLAPWPVYPVDEDEDLKDMTAGQSKGLENLDVAEELGLEVDRKEFLEEHRITWAKPGERPPDAPMPKTYGPATDPNAPKQPVPAPTDVPANDAAPIAAE
jgi:hypothetical protein